MTGPAINHFQQVPVPFWGVLALAITAVEVKRVQFAWQGGAGRPKADPKLTPS
jgi:hypothetical protein